MRLETIILTQQIYIGMHVGIKGEIKMAEFYIGQVFKECYPPECAIWCNENSCKIDKQGDGSFVIVNCALTIAQQEKQVWEQEFYALDSILPRAVEDIMYTYGTDNLPMIQKERNERKKELRQIGKDLGYIK